MNITAATIRSIHQSGNQFVIAITGGGSQAIGDLLSVPGGSQSLLEAIVPYSAQALAEFIGGKPDQACSERTARAMAMAAWERARRLAEPNVAAHRLLGIACTASLASDRPKRGEHRVHIAVQRSRHSSVWSVALEKGRRSREQEERLVADLLLNLLAIGTAMLPPDKSLLYDDTVPELATLVDRLIPSGPLLEQLLLGQTNAVYLRCSERAFDFDVLADVQAEPDEAVRIVFPGAFNPLHEAHQRMAAIASERLGAPTTYELSIENVDKPLLDYIEIVDRVKRFPTGTLVALTRAPTFARKSAIFPGATFIVGADTIVRIADPKYYGHDLAKRDEAIATIAEHDCRFLVFGRTADGEFKTLDQLALPPALLSLCEQIPETEFRWDLSSTQIRQQSR